MATQLATIVVANMATVDPYAIAFEVECFDAAHGARVAGPFVVPAVAQTDIPLPGGGLSFVQKQPLFFTGLTRGTTYSFRARVLVSHGGAPSAWEAWITETAGDLTAPASSYSAAWTPVAGGAKVAVTVTSPASDLDRYEWFVNTSGTAPTGSDHNNRAHTRAGSAVEKVLAGPAGATIYAWLRAVDTSGNKQAWQTLGSSPVGTLDDLADGSSYGRIAAGRINTGRPVIDFSEGIHSNQNLDYIADGSSYGRILLARTSSGRPVVDLATTDVQNKSLDNISDGSSYVRTTSYEKIGANRAYNALDGNSRLSDSYRQTPVNTANTPTAQPLTQSGATKTILIAASTFKFGAGSVDYDSGSVTPGDYGTYYIYADDPTYAGGAVSYVATLNVYDVTAAEGRIYFGKITTASGGGGSGEGGGSGGCFTPGTPIQTPDGQTLISLLFPGAKIVNRGGVDVVEEVLVHDWDGPMCRMPDGELVTPKHCILSGEDWLAARMIFPALRWYAGRVYNLKIKGQPEYYLASGYLAHNALTK